MADDLESVERIDIEETDRLIASDKVEGTPVYNPSGERLGTVYNFMVDKQTGRVEYAVLSFGGFLGIGERYHPLPWEALSYNSALGGYVVYLDKAQLERAPSYAAGDEPRFDRSYGQQVYGYYGFPYL